MCKLYFNHKYHSYHNYRKILINNFLFLRSTPPQSSSEYTPSNLNSDAYNYYDTSSYWNSYSAWQQGYYESEPTSDGYNSYVSDQKPEEDELELIGMKYIFYKLSSFILLINTSYIKIILNNII